LGVSRFLNLSRRPVGWLGGSRRRSGFWLATAESQSHQAECSKSKNEVFAFHGLDSGDQEGSLSAKPEHVRIDGLHHNRRARRSPKISYTLKMKSPNVSVFLLGLILMA
jgi:hypothetical protein